MRGAVPMIFRTVLLIASLTCYAPPIFCQAPTMVNFRAAENLVGSSSGGGISAFGRFGSNQTLLVTSSISKENVYQLKFYQVKEDSIRELDAAIPIAGEIKALEVGDFDSDGRLDLAVLFNQRLNDSVQLTVQVYRGMDDGSFSPFQAIGLASPTGGSSFVFFRSGDLNRDGKLDLIAGRQILIGNRDGTFAPQSVLDADPIAIGAFRSPGLLDLIAQTGFNTLSFYAAQGDGSFSRGNAINLPVGRILVGDWNGDGVPDIASDTSSSASLNYPPALPYPDALWAALGKRDGTFGTPIVSASSGGPDEVADLDQDGRDDIVMGNSFSLSNGDGSFQSPVYLRLGLSSCNPFSGCPLSVSAAYAMQFASDSRPSLLFSSIQNPATTFISKLRPSAGPMNLRIPGVSAATGLPPVGDRSLVSVFGTNLAPGEATAPGPTFPTTLGGVSVHLRNPAGDTYLAPLLYVSPTQINFSLEQTSSLSGESIPNLNLSGGFTSVSIERPDYPYEESALAIVTTALAPGLFTVGSGKIAAATAFRINADGTRSAVEVFSCTNGDCQATPIDLSQGPVYLSFYGTGFSVNYIGGAVTQKHVVANCGLAGYLLYSGPQGIFPGLDQINFMAIPGNTGPVTFFCSFLDASVVGSSARTTQPVTLVFK